MDRGLFILLVGLALVLIGCSDTLAPLRSAWNTTNTEAVDREIRIGEGHQADLDAVVNDPNLSAAQKFDAVDRVEAKWAPAYKAYRALRAVLASTRVALLTAETAEKNGKEIDAGRIAALAQQLITAADAVESAIP